MLHCHENNTIMAFNHEVFRHAQLTDGEKSWHFPLIHKKNQNASMEDKLLWFKHLLLGSFA